MNDYDDMVLGVGNPNHPSNNEELPDREITIDESWYEELKEDYETLRKVKSIFKEWYSLNYSPLEKTSDEKVKLANLENKLIKIMGIK